MIDEPAGPDENREDGLEAGEPRRPGRMRRAWRRLLRVLVVSLALLVATLVLAIVATQTPWFKDWLRRYITRQAGSVLEGQLSIGALRGTLFSDIELERVALTQDGETIIDIGRVKVDYSVLDIISRGIILDELELERPVVLVKQTAAGWNVARLVKPRTTKPGGRGPSVAITRIRVFDGKVAVHRLAAPATANEARPPQPPMELDDLDATLGLAVGPGRLLFDLGHVSFDSRNPDVRIGRVSGRIERRDSQLGLQKVIVELPASQVQVDGRIEGVGQGPRADLSVVSHGLAFRELGLWLPAVREIALAPSFTARVRGPFNRLQTEIDFTSAAGRAVGRVLVDFAAGARRLEGALDLTRVNPAPWAMAPDFTGEVTGKAVFDLSLPDASRARVFTGRFRFVGPHARVAGYEGRDVDARARVSGARVTIENGRARAYGANVTVAGVIEPVPGPAPGARYTLTGRVRGLDLRRLPASLPIPNLETVLDASYDVKGSGRTFDGSAVLADSTVEGARLAEGTAGRFALDGRRLRYGASGSVQGLDLPRLGRALDIQALTDPRFDGAINGTFDVDAEGRTVADLRLTANGRFQETTLLGAEFPDLGVAVGIADRRLTADVDGRFAALEPDYVTGNDALTGGLTGSTRGRVVIDDLSSDITLDTVSFDGTVDLERSVLRGVEIAEAHADGAFSGRAGRLDQLTVNGPMGAVKAAGPFDLARDGTSNLTFTLARGDLSRIGAFVDQPLAGVADVEGTLTGNGSALSATGRAKLENAVYADRVKAAAADVKYTVRIPELDPARVGVEADVVAQKAEVAAQAIDSIDARLGYADRVVTFDAKAIAGPRSAQGRGRIELQEGRQHIVLPALAATVDGVTWQLRPGSEAVLDYDGTSLQMGGVSLQNGTQRVEADGTLAVAPGSTSELEVRFDDIQIAEVNRLLQRPAASYSGRLTAQASIQGTREQPEAVARFTVRDGAFRELKFEEIAGDVHYDGRFLGTDLRLVQQAGTTLDAKGLVPLSLFGDEATRGRDPIDLQVTSSTIGLEVASGLTTALTKLSGTAKVDLHVTGTADNPLFQGGVALNDGAFTVVPTGVHYTGLTSTLRFEPGRLLIDSLRILDTGKDPLEVTGELGLRRTALGAMSLAMKGQRFAVLHNEIGNVDVDADLKVTGELTRPKIVGDVTFHSGRIEVDELLMRLTGRAYDTEPLDDVPVPGVGLRPDEPATVGRITTSRGETRTVRARTPPAAPQDEAAKKLAGEEGATPRGIISGSSIDVRVKIPDNMVLRGSDIRTSSTSLGLGNMNVTVGGDFRIRREPGTPIALVGSVNTVRGSYDYRGRRFDILRDGRIQFQGNTPIDPNLDVTAQRVIQPSGIEARIRIQGTARNPTLSFSSTPPLDEADVLALIVFNRPLNSLGSGDKTSIVDLASSTAAGFVVSPITESLGRALNLDLFEVQATSEGGAGGGLLTIGQQVGDRLYFKFRQQFGAQEVSEFVLEYQLSSFLRLQAAAAEGEGVGRANRSLTRRVERAGLDLIFYFSY